MTQRTCSIDGCERIHNARGWCKAHYKRWRKYGDPLASGRGPAKRHFLENVMTVTDECKVWPYAKNSQGYGSMGYEGRIQAVHVLACIAWHGPRPEGMQAAHGPCHNRACWNGAHLSWKSLSENQLDRRRDGTSNQGMQSPRSKLTDEQVLEIRALAEDGRLTQKEIAAMYGIPPGSGLVSSIKTCRYWGHL